jgi:hypothetical protein
MRAMVSLTPELSPRAQRSGGWAVGWSDLLGLIRLIKANAAKWAVIEWHKKSL